MLRSSWYIKNEKSELISYEFIGICHYYQGNVAIAEYYHNKMIQGTSNYHSIAVSS